MLSLVPNSTTGRINSLVLLKLKYALLVKLFEFVVYLVMSHINNELSERYLSNPATSRLFSSRLKATTLHCLPWRGAETENRRVEGGI